MTSKDIFKRRHFFLPLLLILISGILADARGQEKRFSVRLKPDSVNLLNKTIQNAINKCYSKGGGKVVFPAGIYLCGGLELKSNVALKLEKGALLRGSDNYKDYKNDAFIFAKDATNLSIEGEGVIDGVDCRNPEGEEGFRGPHCVRMINCKNISVRGITIKRSANWALNFRYCSFGVVDRVTILGGHDGFHSRFGNDFKITNCDFRTGDDAFAGNDNRNIEVTDCKVNTACNGFRVGCYNFTVKRCKIWGPGEYVHKIQKRSNMLSAFVHFSPKDDNSKLQSGKWIIEDLTVENVDQFYIYNYESGLWQTGRPVTDITFSNIKATGVLGAFNIIGDKDRSLNLIVKNSSFSYRPEAKTPEIFEGSKLLSPALLNATKFNSIVLRDVQFNKPKSDNVLYINSGNSLSINKAEVSASHKNAYNFDAIGKVEMNDLEVTVAEP